MFSLWLRFSFVGRDPSMGSLILCVRGVIRILETFDDGMKCHLIEELVYLDKHLNDILSYMLKRHFCFLVHPALTRPVIRP